jgi:hypothetical protein
VKKRFALASASVAMLGIWSAGFGAAQSGSGGLSPDAWVHDGDTDGDGLTDAFEVAHGLDPRKASSFDDGTPDESRRDSDGRTMWEVHESEKAAVSAGGGGGSGACGATGLETLFFLLLIRAFRRSD